MASVRLAVVTLVGLLIAACGPAPEQQAQSKVPAQSPSPGQETRDTRIGVLSFESGYPSQASVTKLYDEMDFQRACQAYLWGIPAVGIAEWRLAHRDILKANNGEMLSYLDFKEKLGILTPNYTTPYIVSMSAPRGSTKRSPFRRGC